MFLIFLGVALALGAGLLATASYSEGVLLAIRTAAQCIGWLFLLATAVGVAHLRRGAFGELGAAMVSFVAGVVVLYMAYFQWGTMPDAPMPPIRNAAAAELLPDLEPGSVYKATLASVQIVAPASAPPPAPAPAPVKAAPVPAVADVCASLNGVESLQCRRCGDETGLAWVLCQERARLEYCEGTQAQEALCPSAIPSNLQSPPG
jgi:hypothetical protein